MLAEITAYFKKPLSIILEDLFAKYGRRFISKRLDLELSQDKKKSLMERLKNDPPENIIDLQVNKTIDIDGVKFILEEGSWLLARPSGTEPIVRIYLETDQLGKLEDLEAYAKHLLS
ncbi:MAG: hypothetical protein E3J54_04045 [Actinobacteria bacterium]|nr:MAG: hypothetical protein E3J54_04045 [Actinomycetota bacterium]